jgi:hypothetical protein
MTLGPNKEPVMKSKREQQPPPEDIERFRKELSLKLNRLLAESIGGWAGCENKRCRRAQRCASPDYECIAKWHESLPPLSPEEAAARLEDFRIAVKARIRLGGDSCTEAQLTQAIREEKARRAAVLPPDDKPPMPLAEETQLAPEKQARIDQAWNDYVASLPAEEAETEDADEVKRDRRPRITQL